MKATWPVNSSYRQQPIDLIRGTRKEEEEEEEEQGMRANHHHHHDDG